MQTSGRASELAGLCGLGWVGRGGLGRVEGAHRAMQADRRWACIRHLHGTLRCAWGVGHGARGTWGVPRFIGSMRSFSARLLFGTFEGSDGSCASTRLDECESASSLSNPP